MSIISKLKESIKNEIYGNSIDKSKGLKELRKERLALEGRVKLDKIREREEIKIKQYKDALKEQSTFGKFKKKLGEFKKYQEEQRKTPNPWRK